MKNLFLIVRLKNDDYRYDQWRADFDAEADAHKLFMRGVTIGKIDDHTAMVAAEIPRDQWMLINRKNITAGGMTFGSWLNNPTMGAAKIMIKNATDHDRISA